jgi:hypothetical protein
VPACAYAYFIVSGPSGHWSGQTTAHMRISCSEHILIMRRLNIYSTLLTNVSRKQYATMSMFPSLLFIINRPNTSTKELLHINYKSSICHQWRIG